MAADNDPIPEPTIFSAILTPHRSLSATGFLLFMLVLGGISFAMGIMFLLLGAWPVFGFLGLDVLLVYWAFRSSYRSAKAYEEGGRLELAAKEEDEIAVIQEFLPRQMDAAETTAAIDAAIADLGAEGIRDMGRVMAALKERHAGQMDFGAVGPAVKARLLG